jgi:RNA polymerase sigma factor (sigma-70 family)
LISIADRDSLTTELHLAGGLGGDGALVSTDARATGAIKGADAATAEFAVDAFVRFRNALARRVARLVKPYDVEDIVQETYLRLFQAAKRQPIRSPRAFMLKTVRNLALNRLRLADALNHTAAASLEPDAQSRPDAGADELVDECTPEAVLESQQEFTVFCRAIRSLPRQCRRVFLLRRVYGLSQREVAQRLSISERTVENHIAKAAVQCSDYMEAHGFSRPSVRRAVTKAQARRHE